VSVDETTRAVVRREAPLALKAGGLAVTKAKVEDPILRLVAQLQSSIALDTVRNEYTLHRSVHQWFAEGGVGPVNLLSDRVYAELFLMPLQDPWLGLFSPDVYTALGGTSAVDTAVSGQSR
jgi:hypothetical protein